MEPDPTLQGEIDRIQKLLAHWGILAGSNLRHQRLALSETLASQAPHLVTHDALRVLYEENRSSQNPALMMVNRLRDKDWQTILEGAAARAGGGRDDDEPGAALRAEDMERQRARDAEDDFEPRTEPYELPCGCRRVPEIDSTIDYADQASSLTWHTEYVSGCIFHDPATARAAYREMQQAKREGEKLDEQTGLPAKGE